MKIMDNKNETTLKSLSIFFTQEEARKLCIMLEDIIKKAGTQELLFESIITDRNTQQVSKLTIKIIK